MNEGPVTCPVCAGIEFRQSPVVHVIANIRVIPKGQWPSVHQRYDYICTQCGHILDPVVDEHGDHYSSTKDGIGG